MNLGVRAVRTACSLLAVAAVVVAASGSAGAQTAPYTIYVILPLTGQAAYSGLAESQTLAALEKYTNANGGIKGQPIHFDVHDDQTSPQLSLQLANAAIAQHVPVILGSGVVSTCASIGAAVALTGPVMYCFSPGYSPPKDSYAFASTVTIYNLTKAILLYAKARGFHRVAFIGATDATGIASGKVNTDLLKLPELRSLELVADERVGAGDVSASAQIAKVKAAKPDVIWTSATGTVFSTIMHSYADLGLDVPVITTTANASIAQLKPMAAILPKELYFNGFPYQLGDQLKDRQLREQGKIFADAFELIGVEPNALHVLGWDAGLITLAALRQFGPAMTADQLKTFILAQRHFVGLNGVYNFSSGDQHGLDARAVVMIGWDRDKGEFYPASQPGGALIKH